MKKHRVMFALAVMGLPTSALASHAYQGPPQSVIALSHSSSILSPHIEQSAIKPVQYGRGPFIHRDWKPPHQGVMRILDPQEVNRIFGMSRSEWVRTAISLSSSDTSYATTANDIGMELISQRRVGTVRIFPRYTNEAKPSILYVTVEADPRYTGGTNLDAATRSVDATQHDLSRSYHVIGDANLADNRIVMSLIIRPKSQYR